MKNNRKSPNPNAFPDAFSLTKAYPVKITLSSASNGASEIQDTIKFSTYKQKPIDYEEEEKGRSRERKDWKKERENYGRKDWCGFLSNTLLVWLDPFFVLGGL